MRHHIVDTFADERFAGGPGFIYQRFGNPTTQMFEDRLALLPAGTTVAVQPRADVPLSGGSAPTEPHGAAGLMRRHILELAERYRETDVRRNELAELRNSAEALLSAEMPCRNAAMRFGSARRARCGSQGRWWATV